MGFTCLISLTGKGPYKYTHLTDKETEATEGRLLVKVTEQVPSRAGVWSWISSMTMVWMVPSLAVDLSHCPYHPCPPVSPPQLHSMTQALLHFHGVRRKDIYRF